MMCQVATASLYGLKPQRIQVEVDAVRGIPGFTIIGLPSKAVNEARERVTAALSSCSIRIRSKRTIINLAPADIHKVGSGFDLAIAVGILKLYNSLQFTTDGCMFLGELSLDGRVRPVRGLVALVLAAGELGFQTVIVPASQAAELIIPTQVSVIGINHLRELLTWSDHRPPKKVQPQSAQLAPPPPPLFHLTPIIGNQLAKRALMICAAGAHHLLMSGPPGVGKTELARWLPSLLPPLSAEAARQVRQIYSVAELPLPAGRPFRQPHHSLSQTTLLGGGASLKPGELSLVHEGVLFLDELLECARPVLECLRQPLERGRVRLARTQGRVEYPAQFTLVAATNPCPCGFAGSQLQPCHCTSRQLQQYQHRLSGPLRDRFDLQVWLRALKPAELGQTTGQLPDQSWLDAIQQARHQQQARWRPLGFLTNSEAQLDHLRRLGSFSPASWQTLEKAYQTWRLSPRGLLKIARVSRTIADLAHQTEVTSKHVREAINYRCEPP